MADSRRVTISIKNILLAGITGWIVSLYTLWHRAKVQAGVDLGESFCNINAKINCDTIALSSYSKIGGLAVSTYGLFFFVLVIILALRALREARTAPPLGRTTAQLLFLCGCVSVVVSIGLGTLAWTKIGAFCIVCGIIYLISFYIFFFSLKIFRESAASPRDKINAGFILVAVAVVAAQLLFEPLADYAVSASNPVKEEELPKEVLDQVLMEYKNTSQYELPDQASPAEGDPNTPVRIVEFSDFECPHCARNHFDMPQTLRQFAGKVRVVYKSYPLDPACNSGGMHTKACMAARAARCVYKSGGFDSFKKMQDYLFKDQENFTKNTMRDEAAKLGLAPKDFDDCLENPATYQEIKDEIDLGQSLAVDSTPSIFINGRLLKAAVSPPVLSSVIRNILNNN